MGEFFNKMINGECCYQCGKPLMKEVVKLKIGFPILCEECYENEEDKSLNHELEYV